MELKDSSVMIVDDDLDVLTALRLLLKRKVRTLECLSNPEHLIARLSGVDAVLLDMNFKGTVQSGNEGLYWLRRIKEHQTRIKVVLITAFGDVDLAINALKQGANYLLLKPWSNDRLIATLTDALADRSDLLPKGEFLSQLEGRSPAMQSLKAMIGKVAPTEASVLLLGENGTGKDMVARALHEQSGRSSRKFVQVDVGALAENLFETELFGYKKGAFTDAREDRIGKIEEAEGGTLFLDEIGNINLTQQSKLLSVLQNRKVTPVGGTASRQVDIRLICATNAPLYEMAANGHFRKDLIYRINTVELVLPPLRERQDDIVVLTQLFFERYVAKYRKSVAKISPKAAEKLQGHSWPGNVRELQHTIERAVVLCDRLQLGPDDIYFSAMELSAQHQELESQPPTQLSEIERQAVKKVLERNFGNVTQSAKELGLTRTALYRRMQKYDL